MSTITAVTDDTFDIEVLQSSTPVLVDFWAQWCGPCKALAPILQETSQNYEGKVKFVKFDVEANPVTPPKFNILSIPTLILFKNGKVAGTHIGLTNKGELAKFIDSHA